MNQSQRDHAVSRVNGILEKKTSASKDKHTTPGIRLSNEDRFKAFKLGKYKMKRCVKPFIDGYTNLTSVIDFTGEKPAKVDTKSHAANVKRYNKEADKVKDEIMLGDSDKVLQLIQSFETMK